MVKIATEFTCPNCGFGDKVERWITECPRCGGLVIIERLEIETDGSLVSKTPPPSIIIEEEADGNT